MTNNQINFLKAEEEKRSNLANEEIKRRSNEITYSHNVADEAIRSRSNDITAQANLITEGHYLRSEAETERSNKAKEKETKRSNKAKEKETKRSNKANESIASYNADTNRMNAETQQGNLAVQQRLADIGLINARTQAYAAETGRLVQQETVRSNLAREAETHRSNVVHEENESKKTAGQVQYWEDSITNDAYINSANAAYKHAQISEINKKTEAEVAKIKQQTKESEAKTKLNESKSFQEKTKGVKNIVDSAATVSQEVRAILHRNKKKK